MLGRWRFWQRCRYATLQGGRQVATLCGMKTILTLLAVMCLAGCAGSYQGAARRIPHGSAVSIRAISEDKDPMIRNQIAAELLKRGMRVTNERPKSGFELSYHDEWKWDMMMFLWKLGLSIEDTQKGEVIGTAGFRHVGIGHNYPNTRKVVQRLFEEWERSGAFTR